MIGENNIDINLEEKVLMKEWTRFNGYGMF